MSISRAEFLSRAAAGSAWALLSRPLRALAQLKGGPADDIDLPPSSAAERNAQIERLVRAYPEQRLRALDAGIGWPDGTTIAVTNGRNKKLSEALVAPEMIDQLRVPYPKGRDYPRPDRPNGDPGRIRYEPFFAKMYGAGAAAVASHLVPVEWPASGGRIWVTRTNGVDRNLQRVAEEIVRLPRALRRPAERLGGTFNWRPVRGTTRASPHSFGIAIDLDPQLGDYWQWSRTAGGGWRYRNRIPLEIIEIFEARGFIWGGKWFHFDTMHFEYRPELLI